MLMVNLTLIDLLIGRHSSPILLDIYLLFCVSRVGLEDCSVFSKEHSFILSLFALILLKLLDKIHHPSPQWFERP